MKAADVAQLHVDIILDQVTGPVLMKKYNISQVTLTNHRRKVREMMGDDARRNLAVLMDGLQRKVIKDIEHVRGIIMDNLETASLDPDTYDLQKAIDDALKMCNASARIFQRVSITIDAHTEETTNVTIVQQEAQGDVMTRLLEAKGPDDKPLLSKESRTRILAAYAKPVGGNKI